MSTLAIKGHATRGGEVIGLLEMLGGTNTQQWDGDTPDILYFINKDKIQAFHYDMAGLEKFKIFTLEQFLEKFPYKVGDKVLHNLDIVVLIERMYWDVECDIIRYDAVSQVDENYKLKELMAEHLQPYTEQKEEPMEEKKTLKTQEEVNNYLLQHSVKNAITLLDIEKCLNDDGLELPNGIMIKSDGIGSIDFVRWYEKTQYPKTYEECCSILFGKTSFQEFALVLTKYSANTRIENSISPEPPYIDKINAFYNLLICSDAYWKIAEEVNKGDIGYVICNVRGKIIRTDIPNPAYNHILSFPTEEMRDAFYENFKDLIKECKELL